MIDNELLAKERDLVLVRCSSFCALFTRHHFQILVNYTFAMQNAKTWEDFRTLIGREIFERFYEAFLRPDSDEPADEDPLEKIRDDIWILHDHEFPATQCLEETTAMVGDLIPARYRNVRITTDYGQFIDFFDLNQIENIVAVLRAQGMLVEVCNLPFGLDFRDYE